MTEEKGATVNLALWFVASILAAVFLASGASKLVQPRAKVIASGYEWAEDYSQRQVNLIGVAEVLGAVGLILPAALNALEWLTPTAAGGLALLMSCAALVHIRRNETRPAVNVLVLGAIAAAFAVLRFGPYGL